MLAILKGLLGFKGIAEKIADAYAARQNATTDRERIAADERLRSLEARRDVLTQETEHWSTRWVRPAFALPFVIYNFKLIVIDKVLGLGSTDPLSDELFQIEMAIIGAYFLYDLGARLMRR